MKSSAFAILTVLFVFWGTQTWAATPEYGVGLFVQPQAQGPLVVRLLAGSPAEQAGIKPGDQIVEVDGERTAGMALIEVAKRVHGVAHSRVELTILRPGIASFTASVARDVNLTIPTEPTCVPVGLGPAALLGGSFPVIVLSADCYHAREFFLDGKRFEVPRCMSCAFPLSRGPHHLKSSRYDDTFCVSMLPDDNICGGFAAAHRPR